jgi:hypothetical protein
LPVVVACTNRQNKQNATESYSVQFDTILIHLPPNALQNYAKIVSDPDNIDLLYGYNHLLHKIDVFDIAKGKFVEDISLEHEGPNGLQNISDFVILNNEIYVSQYLFYYKINKVGKVIKKLDKNKVVNIDNANYYLERKGLRVANYTELPINCSVGMLPVSVYTGENILKEIGFIELDSCKYTPFSIPLPQIKKHYGDLETPNVTWLGDSVIYNFPFSSSIYVFSITEGTQREIQIQSIFTKNLAEPLPENANLRQETEYQMKSLQFLSIKYDPFRNLFYRVHISPISSIEKMPDRDYYFTVMDENFNKINEFKLPSSIFSPLYNIMPQGVVFQMSSKNIEDENLIGFLCLKI